MCTSYWQVLGCLSKRSVYRVENLKVSWWKTGILLLTVHDTTKFFPKCSRALFCGFFMFQQFLPKSSKYLTIAKTSQGSGFPLRPCDLKVTHCQGLYRASQGPYSTMVGDYIP